MGVLKKLTSEYFGDTERKEDTIEVPEGVIRVDFTDENGVRHRNGYKVTDGNHNTLEELIDKLINKRGPECDLNDVDVSNVIYMPLLFRNSRFNGDISGWKVSGVVDMYAMFYGSSFDGNISKWDVSGVITMNSMFNSSHFTGKNGNISGWKVNPECSMNLMFDNSPLEKNPPKWYKKRKI